MATIIPTFKSDFAAIDKVRALDDELSKKLMKISERDKRYHNEVFNDIRRDEAFLKSYNEKLVTAYQDLARIQGKPIGKSTEEMLEFLGTKEREAFVIPPAVLDPLVRAYEAKHDFFENEVVALQGDLKRMAATVELLLQDNTKLRSHLAKRDAETSQLLETIGMNDGDTILKLRKQVQVLEDEMRLLYSELDTCKELKLHGNNINEVVINENEEFKRIIHKLRQDIEESKLHNQQLTEQNTILKNSNSELNGNLQQLTLTSNKYEHELSKQKEEVLRQQSQNKELLRRLDIRDTDAKRNEECRIQENSLNHNSISSLKNEVQSKEREIRRLEAMLKGKSLTEGDVCHQLDTAKAKNTHLMDENKELKKRLREIMQTEHEYQDTIGVLKKKISDMDRTIQIQRHDTTGTKCSHVADSKYDEMKYYYDNRIRQLENELVQYKEIVNKM